MYKQIKYLILLLILIFISACFPYRFTIHSNNENVIEGYKLSSMEDVEVKWNNAYILNNNSHIALRTRGQTQGTWDLSFTLNNSFSKRDTILFEMRNIIYERKKKYGVKICFTRDTIKYEYKSEILKYPIPASEKSNNYRIRIFNYSDIISIYFNCSKIFEEKSELPNTEFLFIENNSASRIYFYGIDFALFTE